MRRRQQYTEKPDNFTLVSDHFWQCIRLRENIRQRDDNTRFEDYRAVVVDMLAHSKEWKNTKQALELIVDKGYQARKRWTNFEQVTQEASLIREKIEAERM